MFLGKKSRSDGVSRSFPARRGTEPVPANQNLADPAPEDKPGGGVGGRPEVSISAVAAVLRRMPANLRAVVAEEVEHRRPFLFAPVILGGGSAVWFATPGEPATLMLASLLAIASILFVWFRHRHRVLECLALAMLLGVTGALLARVETGHRPTAMLTRPVTAWITARVMAREPAGQGNWRYRLALVSSGLLLTDGPPGVINVTGRSPPAAIGEVVRGRARLQPPSGPAAPGLFDPSFAAHFTGVGGTGYFLGRPQAYFGPLAESANGWSDRALLALARLRAYIGDHIRQTVGGDEGALAAALVTNEQRSISPAAVEALRQSGLAHIVAISGMNMVLAAGVFFVGLSLLLSFSVRLSQSLSTRKIAAAGAVAGTAAYYLLSGFALSAERAFIMMIVSLLAVLAGRPAISLRSIAISALAILVISPSAALSASFQLSFSGTLGLVVAYEGWARRRSRQASAPRQGVFRFVSRLGSLLAGIAVTALVGGLSTALFSVAHFQRFPLPGFLANMLAAPLIDLLIMPMALAAVLAMPFGLDWPFLGLMGLGLRAVLGIASLVADLGGEVTIRQLPLSSLLLAGTGFLLLLLLRTRLRMSGLLLMIAALVVLRLTAMPSQPDLLIHEDGETGALVLDGHLAIARQSSSAYVTDQWQRMLGNPDLVPPVTVEPSPEGRHDEARDRYRPLTDEEEIAERVLMTESLGEPNDSRFHCRKNAWCAARPNGTAIVLVFNSIYAGVACDVGDIVVARTGPAFRHCRSGALLITHDALRLTGSLALAFTDRPRNPVITPSYKVLARPWHRWRTEGAGMPVSEAVGLPSGLRERIDSPAPTLPDEAGEVLVNDSGE